MKTVSINAVEKRARRLLGATGHRVVWSRSKQEYQLKDEDGCLYGTANSATALGRMLGVIRDGEQVTA